MEEAIRIQMWLERLCEGMRDAAQKPPLQREAMDAAIEIARMVETGRRAIGPRIALAPAGILGCRS